MTPEERAHLIVREMGGDSNDREDIDRIADAIRAAVAEAEARAERLGIAQAQERLLAPMPCGHPEACRLMDRCAACISEARAREEEREACARIAEAHVQSRTMRAGDTLAASEHGRAIAAAIRARGRA